MLPVRASTGLRTAGRRIDARRTICCVSAVRAPLAIVNPAAGNGRTRRLVPWLSGELRRAGSGGHLVLTREPGHGEELAREAARNGHDRILAVGGDGTVQEVVNGLLAADERPSLGIVPGGSVNDLVRSIGRPRSRESALQLALGPAVRPLDVGRAIGPAKTRLFASAAGIGFDAQVAAAVAGHRHRWQRGAVGYLISAVNELRRFSNRRIRLSLDDGPDTEHTVLFIAIANGEYYGGGMQISPGARVDDGMLDLCIVGDLSRLTALREIPGLYRGRHVRLPFVTMRRAQRIRIEGDSATLVHLDGEPFGGLPLTVEVLPGALQVAGTPAPQDATIEA